MTVRIPPAAENSLPVATWLHAWLPALVCVSVAGVVFGVAFRPEIVDAITVWLGSTAYNHCFLVLPMVAALLWGRRRTIAALRPNPSPLALALVPLLSIAWILAASLEVMEGEQLVVVALFEVILLATLGRRIFLALLAPLLFLFFLVPFGAFLVPVLQRFTTDFTVSGLQLFDIPVFADGFIIQIPEGTFEVAEACAGLRFLIASIVFGCFFATVIYRNPIRRVIFIGLSIVVPIVANGLRALGLLILAHMEGSGAAIATDHVLYGWIFFSLITLVLIIVGMSFADRQGPSEAQTVAAAALPSTLRIGATATAALLLALAGPAYLMAVDRGSAEPSVSTLLNPPVGVDWVREPETGTDWHPSLEGAKQTSLERYRDGDSEVAQFVATYPLPSRRSRFTGAGSRVTDPEDWRTVETGRMALSKEGATVEVDSAVIARQDRRRLVWWFYVVDDQITASRLRAKILQARTVFLGGTHVGALIAVSTEAENPARANAVLARFVQTMGPWRDIHPARNGW